MANAPYTTATGTRSAGGIAHKVEKKFKVKVMFMTSSKIICKVVAGLKEKEDEKGKQENQEGKYTFAEEKDKKEQ